MSITSQQYANLTMHAYGENGGEDRRMRHLVDEKVTLKGVTYKVVAHADKLSGYQGTIYQRVDTGQIVVAHRGTEFDREAIKDGLIADGRMVAARTNRQTADAIALPLTPLLSPAWRGRGGKRPRSQPRACVWLIHQDA